MKFFTTVAVVVVVLGGCSDGGGDPDGGVLDATTDASRDSGNSSVAMKSVAVSFSKLPRIVNEQAEYEAWIVTGGVSVSLGRFTQAAGEPPAAPVFEVPAAQWDAASTFVVTLEHNPDTDASPSAHRLLAGNIAADSATLSVAHPDALGTDFAEATGVIELRTPTDATAPDVNGVWFVDSSSGTDAPGLSLPTLPTGWIYEARDALGRAGPRSIGRFADGAGPDSDGAGPAAGNGTALPLPGQDYVDPPRKLQYSDVFVGVEPDPGIASFGFMRILFAEVDDPTGPVTLDLTPQDFPSGTVTATDR